MWLFLLIVPGYLVWLSLSVLLLFLFSIIVTTIMRSIDRFLCLMIARLLFLVISSFIVSSYRFRLSCLIIAFGYRCIYCFRLSCSLIVYCSCFCLFLLGSLGYRFAHLPIFVLFIVHLFFLCGPFPSFLCYLDYLSFHFFICYYYVFLFLVLVPISRFRYFGHLSCFAVLPFSGSVFGTCDFSWFLEHVIFWAKSTFRVLVVWKNVAFLTISVFEVRKKMGISSQKQGRISKSCDFGRFSGHVILSENESLLWVRVFCLKIWGFTDMVFCQKTLAGHAVWKYECSQALCYAAIAAPLCRSDSRARFWGLISCLKSWLGDSAECAVRKCDPATELILGIGLFVLDFTIFL